MIGNLSDFSERWVSDQNSGWLQKAAYSEHVVWLFAPVAPFHEVPPVQKSSIWLRIFASFHIFLFPPVGLKKNLSLHWTCCLFSPGDFNKWRKCVLFKHPPRSESEFPRAELDAGRGADASGSGRRSGRIMTPKFEVLFRVPGVSMTLKKWEGYYPKLRGHGPIFLGSWRL